MSPVFTNFFPENFPPWRVEVYESGGGTAELFLYKSIFFWIILALLLILFLGSALIIRTIVQEVNLLNLKSEFIASVSHEFKTPLTAMGAILERLLGGEVSDPKKAKEYYRILSHDSERLKRLVKNVLDFTKIEEDKKKYRLESADICHLVRREVDSFEKEHELDGFRVRITIDDNIPPVLADEEAINQALHNILDNAAKFSSEEKDIHVDVSHEDNMVKITVRDKGVGIPENEQKKIFEKFFRGKQASSVAPTGTGLGLTLVKHIMEAHGGDVVVHSQPGKGSSFSLIFPVGKGG
jgi:signal transduction histidine kinase